jgi:hypothetical protein
MIFANRVPTGISRRLHPAQKALSAVLSSLLVLLFVSTGFGLPNEIDSTRTGRAKPAGIEPGRESAEATQQRKRKKKRRRRVFAPGTLFGGIEVGSKGVKAIVVERRKINGEFDYKIHFEASKNTKVIDAKGKGVTDSGVVIIEDTAKATADYFNEIKSRNVKPEHIFIVGSSGIGENLDEAQKVVLVSRIAQFTGRTMEFINVEQEVMFSINGLVSPSSLPTSLLVDVGSGNTKYGYHTVEGEEEEGDTDNLVYGGIKFGTGSFAKEVAKLSAGGDFSAIAKANATERIRPQLEDEVSRKPGLQNRNKVYLSGGIVWAMTTLLHPGEVTLPYSTLAPGDINAFHEMVRKNFNNPTKLFEVDLSGITAEADRKAAEVEIKRVANAFNIQEMTAGSEILKTVSDTFKFEGKKIVVIRSSHVAWIYDYVTVKASES